MQALIDGDVCAELPPDDEREKDNPSDRSSRLEAGNTTADNVSGGGGYPVDAPVLPLCSSAGQRDNSNTGLALPTAHPAVAAAAPPPAPPPPPQGFSSYDGARRPSEKVERKRVISAAASASGSAAASDAAASRSPRGTPTVGVRKGSISLGVGRFSSEGSASGWPSPSAPGSGSGLGSGSGSGSGSSQGATLAAAERKQKYADSAAAAKEAQRPSERWRALGILKESWTKLERTRLLFPALMPAAAEEAPPRTGTPLGRSRVDYSDEDEACLCGRRAACRSPMLLPGLFHMLQARLANRCAGGWVRKRDIRAGQRKIAKKGALRASVGRPIGVTGAVLLCHVVSVCVYSPIPFLVRVVWCMPVERGRLLVKALETAAVILTRIEFE